MIVVALAAMVRSTAAEPAAGDPLAQLETVKGQLSWDGIALGTSLVRAERLLGVTLAVDRGVGESPCAEWTSTADRNGLRLTLGFPNARPGAKVQWMRVRFEGAQILASGVELAAALQRHIPDAKWIQPEGVASLEEDLRPTFSIPGTKEPQVVQFSPREWMVLAEAACLG